MAKFIRSVTRREMLGGFFGIAATAAAAGLALRLSEQSAASLRESALRKEILPESTQENWWGTSTISEMAVYLNKRIKDSSPAFIKDNIIDPDPPNGKPDVSLFIDDNKGNYSRTRGHSGQKIDYFLNNFDKEIRFLNAPVLNLFMGGNDMTDNTGKREQARENARITASKMRELIAKIHEKRPETQVRLIHLFEISNKNKPKFFDGISDSQWKEDYMEPWREEFNSQLEKIAKEEQPDFVSSVATDDLVRNNGILNPAAFIDQRHLQYDCLQKLIDKVRFSPLPVSRRGMLFQFNDFIIQKAQQYVSNSFKLPTAV